MIKTINNEEKVECCILVADVIINELKLSYSYSIPTDLYVAETQSDGRNGNCIRYSRQGDADSRAEGLTDADTSCGASGGHCATHGGVCCLFSLASPCC